MTSFIPAFLAVALAEFGGRSTQFPMLARRQLAATMLGLSVGAAAFAGFSLAPTMNAHARALMLGLALLLTGCGQMGSPAAGPTASLAGTLLFVWRSGAPFLAFAFAIWRAEPVAAAAGALAGIAGAVALGGAPLSTARVTGLRRLAGLLLIITGTYAALWALRLV